MPKSKLRGGAKAHRKRVAARAITRKSQANAFQKVLNAQIEDLKRKYAEQSGTTENSELGMEPV